MTAKEFLNSALSEKRANDRQLLVQLGQCTAAVGATEKYSLLRESLPEHVDIGVAGCDGACFATPKYHSTESYKEYAEGMDIFWTLDPKVAGFVDSQTRIAMSHAGCIGVEDIHGYIRNEGFLGLANSLMQPPKYTVDSVDESGLRGRGGAYFPVSLKWRSALAVDSSERHLVVNAEEGEPGVFKDRHIMESVPFRLIEGTVIAAYATNSTSVRIYVNAEAHLAFERLERALDICRMSGFLGSNIMGTEFSIDIQLLKGAGGYVCGEESTLLNTIEGKRREPRLRPPFPTESGLNQKPTIINNVETLSNIPWIMANGADAYRKIGPNDAPGTKVISLSGALNTPGVIEVPMGSNLRNLIEIYGGISSVAELSGIAIGGPSSGVIRADEADIEILPGLLDGKSVMLGAGGVIALSKDTTILSVIRKLSEYNAKESCGKCTPCREGTVRILDLLDNGHGSPSSVKWDDIGQLAEVVNAASLCGLGQAAGNPVLSFMTHFSESVGSSERSET